MYEYRFHKRNGAWIAPPIDPEDNLDFKLNFTNLLDDDDTIVSTTSAVDSGNITIETGRTSFDDKTVTIWLKDGVLGEWSIVSVKIVTARPRTIERSFKILCAER